MKKMFKKNQLIITALAVVIAMAGYVKYANDGQDKGIEVAKEGEKETVEPGDAILVNANTALDAMINAKLQREQIRAQNKEDLMQIVNNNELSESEKKSAVDKVVELADIAEKELAAETLIMAKDIENVVVNMVDGKVEVIIGETSIDDATRVQIEDIVKRKFDVPGENITISLMSTK